MRIEIKGEPIAWMRPGINKKGMKFWVYDEQKKIKKGVRLAMKSQWNACFNNPNSTIAKDARSLAYAQSLTVHLTFLFGPNKSDSKALKSAKMWGNVPHNDVPDWDNLSKFYMDCGNGLLWMDDKIVTKGLVRKDFSKNPRTIIDIMTKENLKSGSKERKILDIFSPERLEELAEEVKKFDYLSKTAIFDHSGEGEGVDKQQWKFRTAVFLAQFAEKFSEDLSKINKYKGMPFSGPSSCV